MPASAGQLCGCVFVLLIVFCLDRPYAISVRAGFVISGLCVFMAIFLSSCDDTSSEVVVQEEPENSEETSDEISSTPPEGIPHPFNLFTVIDSDVPREDFNKVSKWYKEDVGKQVFLLFEGDEFVGERKHARTEAGQGLKFKAGPNWHSFEARMRPSTKLDITYTIAQLFAGCCGPQLRIEVRTNGRIHVGSRSNGNEPISPEEDWADGQKSFKIKIRTNGSEFQVFFNDALKFSGVTEESMKGNTEALYHFRWGVYSNERMKKDLRNTVTEITRE